MGIIERLFHRRTERAPMPATQPASTTRRFVAPLTERATFLVSGTTYRQPNVVRCGRSLALFRLVAEPTNAYDENAVQVLYDGSTSPQPPGQHRGSVRARRRDPRDFPLTTDEEEPPTDGPPRSRRGISGRRGRSHS